jgi:hypothetical protein
MPLNLFGRRLKSASEEADVRDGNDGKLLPGNER